MLSNTLPAAYVFIPVSFVLMLLFRYLSSYSDSTQVLLSFSSSWPCSSSLSYSCWVKRKVRLMLFLHSSIAAVAIEQRCDERSHSGSACIMPYRATDRLLTLRTVDQSSSHSRLYAECSAMPLQKQTHHSFSLLDLIDIHAVCPFKPYFCSSATGHESGSSLPTSSHSLGTELH